MRYRQEPAAPEHRQGNAPWSNALCREMMERISFSRRAWEGKKGERVKEEGGDVLCREILDFGSKA